MSKRLDYKTLCNTANCSTAGKCLRMRWFLSAYEKFIMASNLYVSFKNKLICNLSNAASKENIIQNISEIYTNYEVTEV